MPSSERRYFLCTGECVPFRDLYKFPNSHIIGHLRYVVRDGHRLTALAVYEISANTKQVPPIDPEIRVELIGDARNIKCRYYGCRRKEYWEISKAAFMQLIQRYQKDAVSTDV